jgi:hypothetical protein
MTENETTYTARQARLYARGRWYFHPALWFLAGIAFFAVFQVFVDAILRWAFL